MRKQVHKRIIFLSLINMILLLLSFVTDWFSTTNASISLSKLTFDRDKYDHTAFLIFARVRRMTYGDAAVNILNALSISIALQLLSYLIIIYFVYRYHWHVKKSKRMNADHLQQSKMVLVLNAAVGVTFLVGSSYIFSEVFREAAPRGILRSGLFNASFGYVYYFLATVCAGFMLYLFHKYRKDNDVLLSELIEEEEEKEEKRDERDERGRRERREKRRERDAAFDEERGYFPHQAIMKKGVVAPVTAPGPVFYQTVKHPFPTQGLAASVPIRDVEFNLQATSANGVFSKSVPISNVRTEFAPEPLFTPQFLAESRRLSGYPEVDQILASPRLERTKHYY